MPLEIKILDYGDIELESSFLVLGRDCGRTRRVLTLGFLIVGGPYPVVVDTGYRSNQIMETLGMRGLQFHENMIENQLARHGVRMGDVRYVCHTHLHIDHAGKDDLFPMNTTVVLNRRELEYSVSGLMHPQYPAPDIKHLIDRLHTKSALRFLDLEVTGPVELMPGVYCDAANAHTEGSMNIHVHTADGVATICGDVIYDLNDQIVTPFNEIHDAEPRTTGNHGTSKRAEKASIKKLLSNSRYLLPVHDRPAKIEGGNVVGRLHDQVPGPIWHPTDHYLLFSDMPADVRRRWDARRGVAEVKRPSNKCNGMTYDAELNLIVCEHATSSLIRERPDGRREVIASHYENQELNSPNDVCVHSSGAIYFSDPWYGRMPVYGVERPRQLGFQGVYRVVPGGGPPKLVVDRHLFDQPNGLCFSPDERLLYVNDTTQALIRVFDVEADGSLANARIFASGIRSELEPGLPDGMKCDQRGNVWVTAPGGVWVYSPAGELLGKVRVPEL